MDPRTALDRRIAGLAALDQPVRRDLYRLLASTDGWTTRDAAAAASACPAPSPPSTSTSSPTPASSRSASSGPAGAPGPGAGRPSKLYRPSEEEVAASVPDRRYDLAGSLLADAVAESARTGTPVARLPPRRRTRRPDSGSAQSAACAAMTPTDDDPPSARHGRPGRPRLRARARRRRGEIALANCPFHRLAEQHRDLVCGMNLDLLDGLLDGIGTRRSAHRAARPRPRSTAASASRPPEPRARAARARRAQLPAARTRPPSAARTAATSSRSL